MAARLCAFLKNLSPVSHLEPFLVGVILRFTQVILPQFYWMLVGAMRLYGQRYHTIPYQEQCIIAAAVAAESAFV